MQNTDIIFNAYQRRLYGTGDIPLQTVIAAHREELRREMDRYPQIYNWLVRSRFSQSRDQEKYPLLYQWIAESYYDELRDQVDRIYPVVEYRRWMDERCSICAEPFSEREWEGRHTDNYGCDCHEACCPVCDEDAVFVVGDLLKEI